MDFGSLMGGAAQGLNSDLQNREQTALQYKMRSALIEQQLQGQMAMAQQQQQMEQERFARENFLSPEETKSFIDTMRQPVNFGNGFVVPGQNIPMPPLGKLSHLDAQVALEARQSRMMQGMLRMGSMTTSNGIATDPTTGVDIGTKKINGFGAEVGIDQFPDAAQRIQKYGELQKFVQNLDHAKQLYDGLTLQGGGLAAQGLNMVADATGGALMQNRHELDALNNSTKVLAGQMLDNVPGGRSSLGLGKNTEDYQIRAEKSPGMVRNIYDNTTFQAYRMTKGLGQNAVVDPGLEQRFGWLPRQNGVPINVVWNGGQAYLPGHKTPLQPPSQQGQAPMAVAKPQTKLSADGFTRWQQQQNQQGQ